jgi:hypothetical protein
VSALVWRAGLGLLGAVACLALGACARDPVVTGVNAISAGNWRIEQSKDRITDAPISSAVLTTRAVSHTAITFAPPALMQLSCFKGQPVVVFAFQFKIGSTRNAELGYRFDDRPGHQPRARFVDDYIKVIIEDPAEVAPFISEMAASKTLYVLIRSLNAGRTSAEFKLEGASEAIKAALATCPAGQPAARG